MSLRAPILASVAVTRFVRRVLMERAAWTVAGEEGLVRVDSPTRKGRQTNLMWSQAAEAGRQGLGVVANPRLKRLTLPDLFNDVLPRLAELDRTLGPDWSAEPIRPEVPPLDLARRLRKEAVEMFVRHAVCFGTVWMLQGPEGPACRVSRRQPGVQVLPCWQDQASAEARIDGPWADMVAAEVPLATFRDKTLVWLAESGRLLAPGFCEGDGQHELEPAEFATRLRGAAGSESSSAA